MSSDIVVIKLGGASLQEENVLTEIMETIRDYRKYDYTVVLVHGGGPAINAELVKRDIKWEFINGLRKTTPEMMNVIEDVLFNRINASLVHELQKFGIPALGISGAEDDMLFCEQASKELGLVGSIQKVDSKRIKRQLQKTKSVVPVIAPIGIGANGEKYNINADWAAAKIASALKAKKLIFLTDQNGILNSGKDLIPFADQQQLKSLLSTGVVSGGMYTKVLTVMDALENGVSQVRVMRGSQANQGLWSDYIGTVCGAF